MHMKLQWLLIYTSLSSRYEFASCACFLRDNGAKASLVTLWSNPSLQLKAKVILAVDFILAGKLLCGYLRLPGWHGVLGRVMEVSGMGIGDGGEVWGEVEC